MAEIPKAGISSRFLKDSQDLKTKIKNHFLTGLLVIIPISLTIWILTLIIGTVERFLPYRCLPFYIPGLGIVITFFLITLVGLITKSFMGGKVLKWGDKLFLKIPLARNIYQGSKQLSEAVFLAKDKKFRGVVLLEYPRKGIYSMGFITGINTGELQDKTEKKVINIFLPTTPNPTSGFYLLVPEEDVIYLKMGVEDAFKLLISGGILTDTGNTIPAGKK